MAVLTPERFARLLVRPSRARLSTFVADLYDARGWTVTRRGRDLVVSHPRTGRAERVAVLGARTSLTAPASVDADVVVSRRDATWARAVAEGSDARFVGPADLRESLLYDVDRDRARELLTEHFGASLTAQSAPVDGAALAAAVAVVVVLAGAAAVGAAGFGAAPSPATPSPTGTPPAADAGVTDEGATPAPNTVSTFPPGLDDDGVRSLAELATAHRTAVEGRSYHLLFEQRRSRDVAEGEWVETRQSVTVENRTNYRLVVDGIDPRRAPEDPRVRYVAYADGERVYVKAWDENGTARYVDRTVTPGEESRFARTASNSLLRYLDTDRSDLSRVVYRGREVYLLTAVGSPQRIPGNVTDYRASAIVYPNGFVPELEARYTVVDDEGPRRVAIRYVHRDVGSATVDRPSWLDDRPNGTATPATPTPVGPD
jgi:hypothetical protein